MKKITLLYVLCTVGASLASGAPIFDNSSRGNFQSIRSAENSPLADITVSSPTTIDAIGAMVDLDTAGNLKFLIFNHDTSTLLFSTGPEAFADTGLNFKVSSDFAPFVLQPGINYAIGAIADVGGQWETENGTNPNPFTQNGITSYENNANVSNFAAPALGGDGGAMIMVQLFNNAPGSAPDTGSSLALLGLALAGLFAANYKFKAA